MTGNALPTLILIHGATANGRMWDPLRRSLDPRFRVLTPDLPGHGSRRREVFTLQGAVDTVIAAAYSVSGSPIIVGGDSLGGYTTLASASALPAEQLKGLILGGCSSNLQGLALLPYLMRSAMFRILIALRGEQRLIASAAPKLVSDVGMPQADVAAMVEAGISLRVFPEAVDALREIDFRSKLAAVEQPVLILNGDKDRGHVRQEASFVAVARQATVRRLAHCEHGVTARRPAECAAAINEFSARVFA
jgi:pimeloyl-ACP methyl ester carboxylesterase